MPTLDRRTLLAAAAATGVAGTASAKPSPVRRSAHPFPAHFLWGVATAGHQVEGNNTASDHWYLEHQSPSVFAQPSGDACNSFLLWERDLDLAKALGLNAYRFSIEWARIEPAKAQFSQAMLDHYARVVDGCRARGLAPILTYNHFTAPLWFSAQGGWTNPESASLFARYAERVTRTLGDRLHAAITFNEPNLLELLKPILPPPVWEMQKAALVAAARSLGVPRFVTANVAGLDDLPGLHAGLAAAHTAGKAAIKAVRGTLPVGLSLSMIDDQPASPAAIPARDAVREAVYGPWLRLARADDFLGVQNYERAIWGEGGRVPPPPGAPRNWSGAEVWAPSLAGAVRYAHAEAKVPILVSEHGVGTDDDAVRAAFIPAALVGLRAVIADGIPVLGYCHWSLLDNFEWIFGYKPKFGLASVDPVSFARTPKPSAHVYARIARANGV